jgi:short-subunit dehydrogenase
VKVSCLCPGPTESQFSQVARGRPSGSRVVASARSVAAAGLRGLERDRAIVVPGVGNKLGSQASRFLPRALMRRIVARMKG